MAISSLVHGEGLKALGMGTILWKAAGGSTMELMLCLDAYTPNKDTHDFLDDASANRVGGTSDQALTLSDPTYAAGTAKYDSSDATETWSSVASGTVGGVVTHKETGVESTDVIMCTNDFSGGNITANGSDIEVTPHADGLFKITY
jgi:hypothetical protein